RQPDMGVVQVVRRADAQVVHALALGSAPQLLEMAIEPLELGEEPHVEEIAVENADRVVRIDRGDEPVAGVADRLEVPRRDVAGGTGQREVPGRGHADFLFCAAARSTTPRSTSARIGALRRSEWCPAPVRRPASLKRRRRSGSTSSRSSLSTHSPGVEARKPLTPSWMISRLTPTAAATTGTPQAMN